MIVMSSASHRLTPDEVQAVSFPSVRLGRRGYDEEHVRAFCGQVQAELVRLLKEKTTLADEVQRLRQRLLGSSGGEPETGHGREDAHLQAVRILSKAQQTADNYVAGAQDYSRKLAQDARRRRDEILAEAKSSAALVLSEAHSHGTQAAAAARSESGIQPATTAERRETEAELYLRTFCDV